MRMAKASKADIEMAIELASALDDIERGYLPSKMSDDEAIEWLDTDDARQYARLVEFLQAVMNRGSISRVVWGMAVICDPRNELLDPDDSAIARHPNTVAALQERDKFCRVLQAAVELVCAQNWAAVSDEHIALERVLRECGYVATVGEAR